MATSPVAQPWRWYPNPCGAGTVVAGACVFPLHSRPARPYLGTSTQRGRHLGLGDIADGLSRGVETLTAAVSETFFEPVIRLGVTGLARSGKTVFITSLVANLIDRGRMPQLQAAASGAMLRRLAQTPA